MTPDQWSAAYWIFGTVFVVCTLMFFLSGLRRKKPGTKEAWEHHEDGMNGRF